jgi:hypothetical protein
LLKLGAFSGPCRRLGYQRRRRRAGHCGWAGNGGVACCRGCRCSGSRWSCRRGCGVRARIGLFRGDSWVERNRLLGVATCSTSSEQANEKQSTSAHPPSTVSMHGLTFVPNSEPVKRRYPVVMNV